jgi:hypothetical protein
MISQNGTLGPSACTSERRRQQKSSRFLIIAFLFTLQQAFGMKRDLLPLGKLDKQLG